MDAPLMEVVLGATALPERIEDVAALEELVARHSWALVRRMRQPWRGGV